VNSARATAPENARWALIAGHGPFPLRILEAARKRGIEMVVVAIRSETDPEIERFASKIYWLRLGQFGRMIELLKEDGVTRIVMAGYVKHNRIFDLPSFRPDWRMARLFLSLPKRNTNALLDAVARELATEGIELVDSTLFVEPLLARAGVLTRRVPDAGEAAEIAYGREIARQIAGLDLGQTVVVGERACVAVEAMEGTDETIERAGRIAGGRRLVVVKVSKPNQDMRFDVPVVGLSTIEVMKRAGATALAIDAGRTLMMDGDAMIAAADDAGIAIEAAPPADAPAPGKEKP
jgi:DUF1009 family protein